MKPQLYTLHSDNEDTHWWFVGRRRVILPIIKKIMEFAPNDAIVDIGCGTGGTVGALSSEYRCIGLDISKSAIEFAKHKYPSGDFRVGDFISDCKGLSSDIALFTIMDVLEHLPNDRKVIESIINCARLGSHILITVPANPKLWSQHDVSAEHYRRYTTDSLKELWRGLPVNIKLLSHFNYRLYWPIKFVRLLGRYFSIFGGQNGGNLNLPPTLLNILLTHIFAGESKSLSLLLDGKNKEPKYKYGVSLIALLERY